MDWGNFSKTWSAAWKICSGGAIFMENYNTGMICSGVGLHTRFTYINTCMEM